MERTPESFADKDDWLRLGRTADERLGSPAVGQRATGFELDTFNVGVAITNPRSRLSHFGVLVDAILGDARERALPL